MCVRQSSPRKKGMEKFIAKKNYSSWKRAHEKLPLPAIDCINRKKSVKTSAAITKSSHCESEKVCCGKFLCTSREWCELNAIYFFPACQKKRFNKFSRRCKKNIFHILAFLQNKIPLRKQNRMRFQC